MTMCHRLKDGTATFSSSPKTAIRKPSTSSGPAPRRSGIEVVVGDHETFQFTDKVFGALVQYPDTFGAIHDYSGFVEQAHAAGALVAVAADLLASRCSSRRANSARTSPSAARSASACRWATAARTRRSSPRATTSSARCPGRIVGVSKDSRGKPALRLALARASSTSAARKPPATSAPRRRCWPTWRRCTPLSRAGRLEADRPARPRADATFWPRAWSKLGYKVDATASSSTRSASSSATRARPTSCKLAEAHRMNFRVIDDNTIGISLDETTTRTTWLTSGSVFNGDKRA